MKHIYLDYNASTPIAPEVADAMRPYLRAHYGNPSSLHWAGRPAHQAVEKARRQVASLVGGEPQEIVFTSGGSEANNHVLKGLFFAWKQGHASRDHATSFHVVTTRIEHPAILEPCRFLERQGADVTYLPVDGAGLVDPDDVRRALRPETALVTVMHANNEVGTIEPIADIARICRDHGVLVHTDAAQSIGKLPTNVRELGLDFLSVAGHKLYAPKGVGALYIRSGIEIEPLVHGAGHESGRRAGTENLLLIVALGAACELAEQWLASDAPRAMRELRDRFHAMLQERFGAGGAARVVLNGHPERRLPNTLNVSFVGHVGAELLARLEGVAASTGSACHAGSHTMSPVLAAMGASKQVGLGAIRFSLGRATTGAEIDDVVQRLSQATAVAR